MLKSSCLKQTLACTALVGAAAAIPAQAGPITWSTWSGVTTGVTTGAATATFAGTGVTASYAGELESFVANYPSYGPAGSFSGGTVGNAPPTSKGIVQIFGGTRTGTDTLTFSQAVLNPVIAIWSLGQPGFQASFNFTSSFTIQASGPNAEYGGSGITAVGNTVYGSEGNGVVQFTGSVTSISWTNPTAEDWYGFTVGVPSVAAAVPEPETYALMLVGLGALAAWRRKRA